MIRWRPESHTIDPDIGIIMQHNISTSLDFWVTGDVEIIS